MTCTATRQDKTIYRGQSATFRITVTDEDDERFDLTGSTLFFRVKLNVDAAEPALVLKDSSDAAEIDILTQADDTLGQAEIYLVPEDTIELESINYVYDVWLRKATGEESPIVTVAALIILAPVTVLTVVP